MFSIRRAVSPLDDVRIVWDGGTERKIKESGTYARIIRCPDGRFWMAFEDLHGNVAVSYSYNCHAWSEDRVVFPRKFESGTLVNAANAEIIALDPSYAFRGRDIDQLRQDICYAPFRKILRNVEVHYLYGDSGTGKTRSIFDKHPMEDICRITNYAPRGVTQFDAYTGHPVLVFEEFHSQIPITAMLNYLDIYPVMLPARYYDRVACY